MRLRVLVIDDDPAHAESTAEIVERAGHAASVSTSGEDGIRALRSGAADIVVTDLVMRDRSGLDVVAAANEMPEPERPLVLVVTGYGTENAEPAVLRAGASGYLNKPLGVELFRQELDRLARAVRSSRGDGSPDAALLERDGRCAGMIGTSAAMRAVFDRVRRVADTSVTVLVEGESGTGKELVARALHRGSERRGGPFVAVNCAALSAGLLESELFGHERGAFTGAHAARVGRFEAADGGTLFLDEVGEMDPRLQAKLLRAIEERCVARVGSNQAIPVDVRLVAATNRPLRERVRNGEFREDLFYRLHVVRIALPPLRDRREDVPLLVRQFLEELCREHGRPRPEVDPEVIRKLTLLPWPGNVRQLRNSVETMLLCAERERLGEEDLPADLRSAPEASTSAPLAMRTIAEVERELIENTLREVDGNRSKAARALGISARTLYRRIKELGLS